MMPVQVVFRQEPKPAAGLRSRKKVRTRLAIEDAALALFAEQGYDTTTVEQIAARADISSTTFFRYFPGKADVILSDQDAQLPALQQAIVARPSNENDLLAVRRALQHAWVKAVDPERTTHTRRAVSGSSVLRGLSYDIGQRWLRAVAEALAQRQGVSTVHERYLLTARVALSVFGETVEVWIAEGCRYELDEAIERNFATMTQLCAEWSRREPPDL
jgi:AcrR family transcriptional regulator